MNLKPARDLPTIRYFRYLMWAFAVTAWVIGLCMGLLIAWALYS